MEIQTTATFDELFLKLPRKIQTKADEKTKLFRENPFNTVLRTEKLHPKGHDVSQRWPGLFGQPETIFKW